MIGAVSVLQLPSLTVYQTVSWLTWGRKDRRKLSFNPRYRNSYKFWWLEQSLFFKCLLGLDIRWWAGLWGFTLIKIHSSLGISSPERKKSWTSKICWKFRKDTSQYPSPTTNVVLKHCQFFKIFALDYSDHLDLFIYMYFLRGSILQYFGSSLSYHLSLRSLFCLFLNGHWRHVLLYFNFIWTDISALVMSPAKHGRDIRITSISALSSHFWFPSNNFEWIHQF